MENITDDRGYNQIWKQNYATKVRAHRRADLMIDIMDLDTSKRILEIGCGQGSIADYIAGKTGLDYLATDLCVPFIQIAKENFSRPNLKFEVMDFTKAEQVQSRKFDYVIGNGILHHLYFSLDESLQKIYNLLNDGGKMIFMEPNLHNPYVYMIFSYDALREKAHLEPDEMAFTKQFITDKLASAGFQSSEVQYRDFLLPGIPDFLVQPSIVIGYVVEKIPLLNKVSQSLFIVGQK